MSDERVDTGVVDNTRSPGHHRDQSLGEVEDGVDVGLEYVFPLLIRQVEDGLDFVLRAGVVEEDVDFTVEDLFRLGGDGVAFFLVAQVGRDGVELRRGAVVLEVFREVVHVLLLFLDVVQEERSTFVGAARDVSIAYHTQAMYSQEDGGGPANAAVTSRDHCILSLELMW